MPRITVPKEGEPIRLTPSGSYRVVLDVARPGETRKQVSRSFPTLKAAREFVTTTRADIARKRFIAPNSVTVDELLDRWLTTIEGDTTIRPVTVEGYRLWAKPIRRHLGTRPVAELRPSDVEGFKAWALREGTSAGKGMSARSVAASLGVLRRALRLAVRDELIPRDPSEDVKRPAQRKTRTAHWTSAQLLAFKNAADDDDLAGALRLVACGLRRSEVLGLRWADVDEATGTVTIRQGRVQLAKGGTVTGDPKSDASARVVVVDAIWPGTVELLGHRGPESEYVVLDAVGQPLRPEWLSDRFRKVAAAAGLPDIRLHEVRHSLATLMAANPAVAASDAAALLGHDVATFHATYVRRTAEGAARAAAAAGAAFGESVTSV